MFNVFAWTQNKNEQRDTTTAKQNKAKSHKLANEMGHYRLDYQIHSDN